MRSFQGHQLKPGNRRLCRAQAAGGVYSGRHITLGGLAEHLATIRRGRRVNRKPTDDQPDLIPERHSAVDLD